jgi:hypothetical protein
LWSESTVNHESSKASISFDIFSPHDFAFAFLQNTKKYLHSKNVRKFLPRGIKTQQIRFVTPKIKHVSLSFNGLSIEKSSQNTISYKDKRGGVLTTTVTNFVCKQKWQNPTPQTLANDVSQLRALKIHFMARFFHRKTSPSFSLLLKGIQISSSSASRVCQEGATERCRSPSCRKSKCRKKYCKCITIHVYIYIYIYVNMYICIHVHIYVYVYTYVYKYVYMYICKCRILHVYM